VAVVLGVLVAMSFGSGDFLGGRATRRASTAVVLWIGQLVALVGALVVALAVSSDARALDFGYGAVAGAFNLTGLAFLYYGLAHGRVGVVAPITAVVGALVPVGWALVRGERPSTLVLVGAGLAIVAGALIARETDESDDARRVGSGAAYGFAAGALLGSSLVLLSETSDRSGFWPVWAERVTGLVLVSAVLLVLLVQQRITPTYGRARGIAVAAGILDVTATTLLLVALRRGLLVVVAPVAALAPAFTVLWAWIVFHEHVSRTQIAGLVLALVGLVLVAAG
jgi:drug/metabolite transporter (DMT)-like permease